MIDRTPPNDEQAERALLGHTLSLGRIPDGVDGLAPSDFYRPVNELIWASIIALADHCDMSSVLDHLEKQGKLARGTTKARNGVGDLYLIGLMEASAIVDPAHTSSIIREHSRRRQMITLHQRGLQQAQDPTIDLEEQLRRTEEELGRIQDGNRRSSPEEILDRPGIYSRDQLDQLSPRADAIDGLLPRRGLALLAAWRGSAKSFLAADAAGTISTGLSTFWVARSTCPGG